MRAVVQPRGSRRQPSHAASYAFRQTGAPRCITAQLTRFTNTESSLRSDFNRDYHVTFSAEDLAGGEVCYNYAATAFPMTEGPGISVFCKDDSGRVFHTYSSYARGLDMFIGAYHLLDIVPKGRDEDTLDFSMEWIRHHDRYDEAGP